MDKSFQCEHMVREGICGANLDVCCVYQNSSKYFLDPDHFHDLHSIRETWCDYPNVSSNEMYVKAIEGLARIFNNEEVKAEK